MNTSRLTLSAALVGAVSFSLLPVGSSQAQTTATTVPVGYQQLKVLAATSASAPTSTVVAVPFYPSAAFAGPVTSVDSASTLSSSSAGWTASQFASATAPYLLHFKSGTSVGRYFLITANTATQLTVANRGFDLTAVSAMADTFEVVPAYTLGLLYGTTTVPFQTNTDVTVADNVLLWNGTSWDVFYHNGTNWRRSGSFLNQNNVILYPDEAQYITRRATTDVTLTYLGTVPSVTERSDLVGPGSTFVSNRFPVDTTLVNFGFQNLPNWISNSDVTVADNVLQWNGTGWNVYYYNGTNWRRSGSFLNLNTQVIPSGTGLFVTRRSTATGTTATLAQTLPYTLN